MRTHVRFRSRKFPPYEGEIEEINPGIWGKRLVEYLARGLSVRGIACGEPFSEDWGWYLPLQTTGHPIGLCCGHQFGDDDEFVCFTDPSEPIVKRFLKRIDLTSELSTVVEALADILESDSEITEVVWSERT